MRTLERYRKGVTYPEAVELVEFEAERAIAHLVCALMSLGDGDFGDV